MEKNIMRMNDQGQCILKLDGLKDVGTRKDMKEKMRLNHQNLEMLFFLQEWFDRNFLNCKLTNRISHHKTSNRNESRVSEEGFRMNLATIFEKVEKENYYHSMFKVIQDIWGLIRNYKNRPDFDSRDRFYTDVVSRIENSLNKLDENKIVKDILKLCCASSRSLVVRAVACRSKDCQSLIEVNSFCYLYDGNLSFSTDKSEIIRICVACYERNRQGGNEFIEVKRRNQNAIGVQWTKTGVPVSMKHLRRERLSSSSQCEWEPTVECVYCGNSVHTVCAMYDEFNHNRLFEMKHPKLAAKFRIPYCCVSCSKEFLTNIMIKNGMLKPGENVNKIDLTKPWSFTMETVPHTNLSSFMESELLQYLFNSARSEALPLPTVIGVRELCSRMKVFEAKPRMKKEFQKANAPFRWVYRYRSVMVYQWDSKHKRFIAIFNLIVHEYPDLKTVYLSYIDSVKLFEPAVLRTPFFQKVILSYLEYLQSCHPRRYKNLHLWVCPPNEGDDYCFYGKPNLSQEVRHQGSPNGLINWYTTLMNRAEEDGLISSFYQVGPSYNPYNSLLSVPYLMGDFWVDRLETLLEEHERRQPSATTSKGKSSKVRPKTVAERLKEIVDTECQNLLFAAKFCETGNYSDLAELKKEKHEIEDEEVDIVSNYMGSRDNFLVDCRENRNDFSDSRRATYSTHIMLSRIAQESHNLRCKACVQNMKKGVYCVECDDEVFCSEVCAQKHDKHSEFRWFRVALADNMPDEGEQICYALAMISNNEEKDLLKLATHLESVSCIVVNEIKYYLSDSCKAVIRKMLFKGFKNVEEMTKYHLDQTKSPDENCSPCNLIWAAFIRHKKRCRGSYLFSPPSNWQMNSQLSHQGQKYQKQQLRQRLEPPQPGCSKNLAFPSQQNGYCAAPPASSKPQRIKKRKHFPGEPNSLDSNTGENKRISLEPTSITYVNLTQNLRRNGKVVNSSSALNQRIQDNKIISPNNDQMEIQGGFIPLADITADADSTASLSSKSPFTRSMLLPLKRSVLVPSDSNQSTNSVTE